MAPRDTPSVKAWVDKDLDAFVSCFYNYRCEENFDIFFKPNGDIYECILDLLQQKFDKTKTPGVPIKYLVSRNDAITAKYSAEFNSIVNHRVKEYIKLGKILWETRERSLYLTRDEAVNVAIDLVKNRLVDAVLVGPKGEARLIEKNTRLVAQVSVIQNSVARFIFGDFLIEEQEHPELPLAVKLDIVTPEKTQEMYNRFSSNFPVSQSDVKGWEYSVTIHQSFSYAFHQAIIMGLWNFGNDQPNLGKENHFYALLAYHYTSIYRVVQIPTGELIVPPPGQTSSGELATFSKNSFVRSLLSNSISRKMIGRNCTFILSAGDDSVDSNQDYSEEYLRRGHIITDFRICNEEVSFCSTMFKRDRSYLENIHKMLYNMLHSGYDPQAYYSFHLSFNNHPEFAYANQLLREEGYFDTSGD